MKLIKGTDIVDFNNPGTIDAYKAAGYSEYKESPKPEQENPEKQEKQKKSDK